MGRTSDARLRIVESAMALWHERSYADVGITEICERADVRKGSFYHFFPSKSDLAVEVLDEQWRRFRAGFGDEILYDRATPPLERLDRMMAAIYGYATDWHAQTGHIWGCPVGNLAVELSTQDEIVRARVNRFFQDWAETLEMLLDEAVAAGDIRPLDTKSAALEILAYVEGTILLAKTGNDPGLVARLGPAVRRLINAPEEVAA